MDKAKPTYLLKDVKRLVTEGCYLLTKKAQMDAHALGFSNTEVSDILVSLEMKDFYKSTTEYYDHAVWQDVNKRRGQKIQVYIKFKITSTGENLVITSFKRIDDIL